MKKPVRASVVTQQRREGLVAAAFHQIAARGFEGLRTRDVANEVGVNIATLHYYFPSKESLIRAVLEHAMDRFRSTLAPHGSPSDQLRNHLRAVHRLMTSEPELAGVMSELALRSTRDKKIAKMMNEMYEYWQTTMRGLLRRAVREGEAPRELDSDAVAALIIATLTGMTVPVLRAAGRGDQVVRQLERWLSSN